MTIRRGGASSAAPLGDLITGVVLVRYCWEACPPGGSQYLVITGDILKAHLYALTLFECQRAVEGEACKLGCCPPQREGVLHVTAHCLPLSPALCHHNVLPHPTLIYLLLCQKPCHPPHSFLQASTHAPDNPKLCCPLDRSRTLSEKAPRPWTWLMMSAIQGLPLPTRPLFLRF